MDQTVLRPSAGRLKVLVVDDDQALRDEVLIPRLEQHGYLATGVESTKDMFQLMVAMPSDMVILDAIPGGAGDGLSAVLWLRDHFPATGIVMLMGCGRTDEHIRGLLHGADAYIAKPVHVELLLATLHSVYRRLAQACSDASTLDRWSLGGNGWHLCTPTGVRIPLTKSERKLMMELAGKPGALVTREQLIGVMTDNTFDYDPHRLESLVYRIRRKVQRVSGCSLPLTPVHGEGYVLAC